MIHRNELIQYLSQVFAEQNFPDYSYNGLQFEGAERVKKVVAGVDATVEFFEKASRCGGDFALVHHGIFWKGAEWTRIDRLNKRIFQTLVKADLNLYAVHLPLDAHPQFGNNAVIARLLDAKVMGSFGGNRANAVGIYACFPKALPIDQVKKKIEKKIGPVAAHLDFGKNRIRNIGIVSGGGWSSLTDQLVYDGQVDLIITGEIIHQAVAACRDREIHMISAGHYATEVFGVKALGEHLADKFSLDFDFIDLPTGL